MHSPTSPTTHTPEKHTAAAPSSNMILNLFKVKPPSPTDSVFSYPTPKISVEPPPPPPAPVRRTSLFSFLRRSESTATVTPAPVVNTHVQPHHANDNLSPTRHGHPGAHSASDVSSINHRPSSTRSAAESTGGIFTMGYWNGNGSNSAAGDPMIGAALQKVREAEEAEKEADRALMYARSMVKEARDQVKLLELEASEGAKRAKEKQAEAKMVIKSAKSLGRHG